MQGLPLRHQIRQPTWDNYGLVTTWKCQGALPVKSAIFMPCDFWQSSYGWRMEHASGDIEYETSLDAVRHRKSLRSKPVTDWFAGRIANFPTFAPDFCSRPD